MENDTLDRRRHPARSRAKTLVARIFATVCCGTVWGVVAWVLVGVVVVGAVVGGVVRFGVCVAVI